MSNQNESKVGRPRKSIKIGDEVFNVIKSDFRMAILHRKKKKKGDRHFMLDTNFNML